MDKRGIPLDRALADFNLSNQADGKSAATIRWYTESVGDLITYLTHQGMSTLLGDVGLQETRQFVVYMRERTTKWETNPFSPTKAGPLSTHTINSRVRALKAFFNWLGREGYTEGNTLTQLKVPRAQQKMVEILSENEIEKLVTCIPGDTALGARNRAMVLTFLDTGLRCSELATLKDEDARLDQQVLRVLGKGNKERIVPVGARCLRALLRYRSYFRPEPALPRIDTFFLATDGGTLTVKAVQDVLERLGKRAGVPRLHAHLLRHTFATMYLMNGGDVFSLKTILGHTTLEMVGRYVNLARSHVSIQHKRFSPVDALDMREPRGYAGTNGRR